MKTLSQAAFEQARHFLKTQARPLERALFEHHFENAPIEAVWNALKPFANPDGGFGHGLEADMRCPSSSALATETALGILREVNTPASHPLVQAALAWLGGQYQAETKTWRILPSDANQYPHAPWWHDENGSLARTFGDFRIIPRAKILAALYAYDQQKVLPWLAKTTEDTVRCMENETLGEGGGDDLVYSLDLASVPALPEVYRNRILKRVLPLLPARVTRDPQQWNTYCILPLKLAPLPTSAGADLLKDEILTHLDYLIEHQGPEGAWLPNWSWFDRNADGWDQAKVEWSGNITYHNLLSLQAFGRLAA